MPRSGAGRSRRGGGHRRGARCPVPEKTLPEKCWKERLVTAFPDGERRIHDCRPFAPAEKGITSPGVLTCEFFGGVRGNCFLVYLGGNFHRHMPALRAARIPLESRSGHTDPALVTRQALLPADRVLCLRGWSAPVAPEHGGVRGGLRQERVREGLTHAPVTVGLVPEAVGPLPRACFSASRHFRTGADELRSGPSATFSNAPSPVAVPCCRGGRVRSAARCGAPGRPRRSRSPTG